MACDGPDGSRYVNGQCVYLGGGSSCDELGGKTCWYGYLDIAVVNGKAKGKLAKNGPFWFGGQFVDGGFRIDNSGPLNLAGVNAGDVLLTINGRAVALMDQSRNPFASFGNEKTPAAFATALRTTSGSLGLRLHR